VKSHFGTLGAFFQNFFLLLQRSENINIKERGKRGENEKSFQNLLPKSQNANIVCCFNWLTLGLLLPKVPKTPKPA
jgi:hypothetical protein